MIFCVEDDSSIRELIIYTLQNTGFDAQGFESGKELFAAMTHTLPDLILLDIMLPGEDGITILKKTRSNTVTKDIPIMLLTAKGSEYDKVIGLDSGADDYITKPFGMMELISRIKAVLRRSNKDNATTELIADAINLDPTTHRVTVNGQSILLTLKEFSLLHTFMENRGIVLTRDRLLNAIWGYDFNGETRTVDVHIRSLRQKLGKEGNNITTIRGIGYRFDSKSGEMK